MAAVEEVKLALARDDKIAAGKAAVRVQRVPEHLRRRLALALDGVCSVSMCNNIEADHAILASKQAGIIDFCLSRDLDFIVMVSKIHVSLYSNIYMCI